MNHRQRMLAGNKIQQMLNNESYKEFPDMCRNYALNAMKKLAPSKVVRTYEIHLREAPYWTPKELEDDWLFTMSSILYILARENYSS